MDAIERATGAMAKKRRVLSDQEKAIFDHAMRDVEPLRPGGIMDRKSATAASALSHAMETGPGENPSAGSSKQKSPLNKFVAPDEAKQKAARKHGLHKLDHNTRKKLVRERMAIDAKIDLHGDRQDQAHNRLQRFVEQGFDRGLKVLLVITGKGTSKPASNSDRFEMPSGRGVLKANVPRWLAEPAMARYVWAVEEAGPRHGGKGAYYIMLRRAQS